MISPWKLIKWYKQLYNFIFGTKFSHILLLHGKHSFGKVLNDVRIDEIYTTKTYLYFAANTSFSPSPRKMLLNLATKIKFYTIVYHHRTFNGYVIMITIDSCIIWFHFDCIMQST